MLIQKKVEIFLVKFRKSQAKQFLEIALCYIECFFTKSIISLMYPKATATTVSAAP